MRLPAIIGIALVSLIAVWYVAIAPRVELGASRVVIEELNGKIDDTETRLRTAQATLDILRTEAVKTSKVLMQLEQDRVEAQAGILAIEARYSNYIPKDKEDEATKCLYLKPPADLRRVLKQD